MPRRKPDPPDQLAADAAASAEEVKAGAEELAAAILDTLTGRGRPASRTRAKPKRVPLSLRRSANKPGGPRTAEPPQRLVDAADAGLLTRSNTRPGSAGRRAVDRAVYLRRRTAEPGLTAREALGHRPTAAPPTRATFYTDGPPRMVTVEGVSLRDVHRAARYMGEVGALLDDLRKASGDTARTARVKRDFHRRISRRAPIAGLPMLADIDALVALAAVVQATGTPIIFDSGRSRPGRRRR